MAYSKVILDDTTLMDVTQKTVDSNNLLSGETALKNDGTGITGNVQNGTITNNVSSLPSGASSSGTINSGKYIQVGSGYYGQNQYYKSSDPTTLNLTAEASDWSGSAGNYTQTITATGVTSDGTIIAGLSTSATSAEYEACARAELSCTAQGTDSVTLTCTGTLPTIDLPIQIILI